MTHLKVELDYNLDDAVELALYTISKGADDPCPPKPSVEQVIESLKDCPFNIAEGEDSNFPVKYLNTQEEWQETIDKTYPDWVRMNYIEEQP